MTDQRHAEEVATLREQVSELVQQIDGPLRKVSASAGDTEVTVEWAEPEAVHHNGAEPVPEPKSTDDRITVTAPLVGTFYRAPEPGADPFVEVGSTVEAGQTVGIVEAMKLMNPVKATGGGTVTAIHAENGQMVEFDECLVELAP